jgi:hypothetical protein
MKRLFITMTLFTLIAANGPGSMDQKGNKVLKNMPNGYDTLSWGTMLTDAKAKIRGKLYFTDEKTLIISREGNLEYHYGFFYIDPALVKAEGAEGEKKQAPMKADEGKLFYVVLRFPYLSMEEVRKKIEDKYGLYTNEDMNNFQGALAWNGEKTIIIMWVDRYEDKPYCGRITYVSKEISKELNEYNLRVFNRVEREIIRKLTP